MKLHNNQLILIRHLVRFHSLDYNSCLDVLATHDVTDRTALSYAFRPLTKNKYVSKNKNGIVSILTRGRKLFPQEKQLISCSGNNESLNRVLTVSRMAALMEKASVVITGKLPKSSNPHFIPSACWRNIAPGILSTTRFTGMLLAYGKKYAVYDIGDGSIEWQVRAESSLFYTRYGAYETKADGMIFICDNDKKLEVAENIIRHTMWNRKALLNTNYTERNRPVRFSKSPIKLRVQYEHVYLTTPKELVDDLSEIFDEEEFIKTIVEGAVPTHNPIEGDLEKWPLRYFINPAFDLLKLVYFFSTVKALHDSMKTEIQTSNIKYAMMMYKKDLKIMKMYPDVLNSERVVFYKLRSD